MKIFSQVVVDSEESVRSGDGRIVGSDGLDEDIQGSFDAVKLALNNGIHDCEVLFKKQKFL